MGGWQGPQPPLEQAAPRQGGGAGTGKTPIIGAVSRKGNVIARVLDHVNKKNVEKFVREAVSNKVSLLATDEHQVYWGLKEYPHAIREAP